MRTRLDPIPRTLRAAALALVLLAALAFTGRADGAGRWSRPSPSRLGTPPPTSPDTDLVPPGAAVTLELGGTQRLDFVPPSGSAGDGNQYGALHCLTSTIATDTNRNRQEGGASPVAFDGRRSLIPLERDGQGATIRHSSTHRCRTVVTLGAGGRMEFQARRGLPRLAPEPRHHHAPRPARHRHRRPPGAGGGGRPAPGRRRAA